MTSVDELLRSLQGEGEMHSHGQFTLDPGRNRDKIATFLQQTDRAAWLYWFVRCAVSLEASGCDIRVGSNGMLATLDVAEDLPALERFLESGHEDGQDASLSLLRTSLLWAQSWLTLHPGFSAQLHWQRPGRTPYAVHISASQVTRLQDATVGRSSQLMLAFLAPSKAETFFVQERAHLAAVLPARLPFCPISVSLDGHRLDSGQLGGHDVLPLYLRYYLDTAPRNRLAVCSPHLLPAHHYRLETADPGVFSRPRFCLPAARVHTLSLAGRLSEQARWSGAEGHLVAGWSSDERHHEMRLSGHEPVTWDGKWAARALLHRGAKTPDRWAVVHFGLLLDWEILGNSSSLGWQGVVALDKASTDLSGLRLTQDQLFQDLGNWLWGEVVDIHCAQQATQAYE